MYEWRVERIISRKYEGASERSVRDADFSQVPLFGFCSGRKRR